METGLAIEGLVCRRQGSRDGARDEFGQGLGFQVLQDSPLAFEPGLVQGARDGFPAGTVLHDAPGNAEGSCGCFHCVPERYLLRGASQARASPPPLAALHQSGPLEAGHNAREQAARDAGFGGDLIRRHLGVSPGEVE